LQGVPTPLPTPGRVVPLGSLNLAVDNVDKEPLLASLAALHINAKELSWKPRRPKIFTGAMKEQGNGSHFLLL